MIEPILFCTSLVFCSIIVYILGLLWFGDTRNRHSKSFFTLGAFVTLWILLNAVAIVCDDHFFPFIYSLRMALVAIVPFCVLWFILNFAQTAGLHSRLVILLIWFFPALDVLTMLTNPLHYGVFSDYNFPVPTRNFGFWIHSIGGFVAVVLSFIVLLRHIFTYARKEPLVIIAGFCTFLPYILNVLYTSGIRFVPYDITPLGFFVTFMLFAFSSYKSQLLNMKAQTISSIFSLLKDTIVIANDKFQIMDVSPAAAEIFDDFSFEGGQVLLGDFLSYLKANSIEYSPSILFYPITPDMVERNGELRLYRQGGRIVSFTVTLRAIMVRNKPSGYIMVMSDVSVYRSMISKLNKVSV